MSTFKIPVSWQEYGFVEIEASSVEDAIKFFDDNSDEIKLPNGYYVEGSFERECLDIIKEYNNS